MFTEKTVKIISVMILDDINVHRENSKNHQCYDTGRYKCSQRKQ